MSRAKLDCPICAETRAESKTIACPYCSYIACVDCYKHVTLDSINKPACINPDCKRQFADSFTLASFPKVWLNKEYKAHRENLLLAQEKALLPQTQPAVERRAIQRELVTRMQTLRDQKKAIDLEIDEMTREWRRIEQGGPIDEQKSEKKEFICPCPDNNCRGFLSSRYKCGTCGLIACSDCRERKEEEHKCNADTVATVLELKKNCRNCPNCMSPIFKVSGCSQMFCTKDGCHTAFNWETGKVEKGIIHNPHYFEWLRTQGNGQVPRNPHEVQCGGMPPAGNLQNRRFVIKLETERVRCGLRHITFNQLITALYRNVNHIRDIEMRGLPTAQDNVNNLDLRISYLEQEITEDELKIKLQRREKDRNKQLDRRGILDVYCNVMQDLFIHLFQEFDIIGFLQAEQQIFLYTKNAFADLSKRYNCSDLSPWRFDGEVLNTL